MVDVVAGLQLFDVGDFQFPVLYELLRLDVKHRPINFGVRLLAGDDVLAEETKASFWMGRDEWIDSEDTYEYLPAFVNPSCSAVATILDMARPTARVLTDTDQLDGDSASLQGGEPVDLIVKAIYTTLRDFDPRIAYAPPPPQLVGRRGKRMVGQRVRSPAQILKDQRGTCHDLALLVAACLEAVRLYPLVVLVPGHSFVGYWRSADAHHRYCPSLRGNTKSVVRDVRDLLRLADSGGIALLDAIDIADPAIGFGEACAHGRRRIEPPAPFDVAIDVRAAREFVDTLE
jgi:hypothetical protein